MIPTFLMRSNNQRNNQLTKTLSKPMSKEKRWIAISIMLLVAYNVAVHSAVQCNIGLKMFSYESGNAICAPISSYKCIESCEWNTSCSLTSHYAAFLGRRSYVSGMVLTNNSFLVQCCSSLSTIVQMNAQQEPTCVWVETAETVENKANVRFDPPLASNEYVREMFLERKGRGRVSVKAQICKFIVQRTNCDKKTMTSEEMRSYSLLLLRLSRTKEILSQGSIKPTTTTVASATNKKGNDSTLAESSFRDEKPLSISSPINEVDGLGNKQTSRLNNPTSTIIAAKSENGNQNSQISLPSEKLKEKQQSTAQYRTTMRSNVDETKDETITDPDAESALIFNSANIFDTPQQAAFGGKREDNQQSMAVLAFASDSVSISHNDQVKITEAINDAVHRHMHKDQPIEAASPAVSRRIFGSNNRNNDATISPRIHIVRHVSEKNAGVQRRSANSPDNIVQSLAMAAPRANRQQLLITHDDSIADWSKEATAATLAALHEKNRQEHRRHLRPAFISLNGSYEDNISHRHRDDPRQNVLNDLNPTRRLGLRQIQSSNVLVNSTTGLRSGGSHTSLQNVRPRQTISSNGDELPIKKELQIRKLKTVTMESLGSTPIGPPPHPTEKSFFNDDESVEEHFSHPTSFGGSFGDLRDYYSATNNQKQIKPVQQLHAPTPVQSGLEGMANSLPSVTANGPLRKAPNFKIIPLQPQQVQSQQQGFLSFNTNSSAVITRPPSVAQALLQKQRQRQAILEKRRLEQQQELLKSNFAELEAVRASANAAAAATINRQPNPALSHSSLTGLLDCCQKQAPGCKNLCSKEVSKEEIKHALVSQQCPPLSMTSVIQCFPRYYNISSVTQCCSNAARPRQPLALGVSKLPEQCLSLCAPDFKLSFAHFTCIDHISSIVECYRDLLK